MKKIIFILIAVCSFTMLFAVFEYMPGNVQPRTMCLATTSLIMGIDNIVANPASISGVKRIDGYLSYENLYLFAHAATAGFGYKFNSSAVGLKYSEFFVLGDYADEDSILAENTRLHTERTVQLTYGGMLQDVISVGTNVNFLYLSQKNETQQDFNNLYYTVDLGLIGKIYDRWSLGISVFNLTNTYINGYLDTYRYYVERKVSAGLSFEPYTNLVTSFDVSKVSEEPTSFGFGIVYEIVKNTFEITTGVRSFPVSYGAGFKAKFDKMSVDYGYTGIAQMPSRHHVQISYFF
ncbi:TPA: hypothetical protein DCW38_01395 [candidate division WOR-3 bacterium]|jgi:hypothetical protein|uniref:PorV/PorQ family protein n=1 Tax=candidate division WOR-3 bacterium TaxID=2052148 RepID=A0A350H8F6_UNCW3|nr:hypothetical protein [candidate division WOR-3 bacterium]